MLDGFWSDRFPESQLNAELRVLSCIGAHPLAAWWGMQPCKSWQQIRHCGIKVIDLISWIRLRETLNISFIQCNLTPQNTEPVGGLLKSSLGSKIRLPRSQMLFATCGSSEIDESSMWNCSWDVADVTYKKMKVMSCEGCKVQVAGLCCRAGEALGPFSFLLFARLLFWEGCRIPLVTATIQNQFTHYDEVCNA